VIADLIVSASVALTLAFVAAWALSSELRAWIERPKYRFLDALREFDRADHERPSHKEQHTS
jgi:ABC-type phosphate/phosphonate transport system permease subunit